MEYFKADVNLHTTDELDIENNEELLEKMDDYHFASYVENYCSNLQKSHGSTEGERMKHETKNSLVWEKSFEHEILLDVDDDVNLNFNDICNSYTICLSQSSSEDASVNITADAICKTVNKYDSDEEERINTEEINNEHNQGIHGCNCSDMHDETKHNLEGFQCHNTAASTSDEEQEELPYDGNLKNVSHHQKDKKTDLAGNVPPLSRVLGNLSGLGPVSGMSQNIPLRDQRSIVKNMFPQQEVPDNEVNTEVKASSHENKSEINDITSEQPGDLSMPINVTKAKDSFQLGGGRSSISETILQHLLEDEALSSSMYIDAETLPETSFTDSIEETVIMNQISSASNNDLFMKNNTICKAGTDLSNKEETDGKFGSEEQLVQVISDSYCNNITEVNVEKNGICRRKAGRDVETASKIVQEENTQAPLSHKTASGTAQNPMIKMRRTISYNEIKYGKGKQHYPLLDLSKVAPKVKFPKRNTYNNYKCQRSKNAKSSPNSSENLHNIYKSTVDVVQNIPDDAELSAIATETEVNIKKHLEVDQTPENFQQLQEEFDKLLIKYAEAENTIDQLRFGGKRTVTSDISKSSDMIHFGILPSPCQIAILTSPQQPRAEPMCTFFPFESTCKNCSMSSSVTSAAGSKPDSCQSISEFYKATAEQMAQQLNKHIKSFKCQVEDFKNYLNFKSFSVEDKQEAMMELRDGLDRLERTYIATKDEHRHLQHRCYLEKNTNVGEFDPDREIEGEIFRIGMALENIKEQIDEDICNQSSLPSSIFTSTSHSIPELSSSLAVYSESCVTTITQGGPREVHGGSLLTDGSATQNIFQMQMKTNENNNLTLLEEAYNHIPQRQVAIVPTKAENNIHSSVNVADLSLNRTLELQNTSFQGQELLNKLKQMLIPDRGAGTLEGSRPTVTHTLNSEQPQMERNSGLGEHMLSSKSELHNANGELPSMHTDENINELGNNKVRQLLQMADPLGRGTPFNWHKSITSAAESPTQQGEAFLQLDFLTECSDDHIPLPDPQQCTPRIPLQQPTCDTDENKSLSQPCSARNEEIMELQLEVAKLKQKLEENPSQFPNDPKTKRDFESVLQKQSYSITSCHRKKTSSRSVEHDKLMNNSLKDHKRKHSTWLQSCDDASDAELCNGMDYFSDTEASVYSKPSFITASRTAHHKQIYSRNWKSNNTWSDEGLSSSSNGQNLQRRRRNTSSLHNKIIPFKHFSESSSRQSRSERTSSDSISSTAANKYPEMLKCISPVRSTIDYSPISRVSKNYDVPSYEIIKKRLQCLPNQIYSTKYFWRNCTDKSISIPEISHLNANLDRAIEAARRMKKTTRRMVNILSADLAKTEYYKYLYDL